MEDKKGSAASRVQLTVKVAFTATRSGAWTLTTQKTLDVQRARVKLNIVVPIILRIGKVVQEKIRPANNEEIGEASKSRSTTNQAARVHVRDRHVPNHGIHQCPSSRASTSTNGGSCNVNESGTR
jgi:hypothetical protein